jgi:2-keto-3-deoxy-galactonokinase
MDPTNEDLPISIWKVMNPGTHAKIVQVLENDAKVRQVLAAFTQSPSGTTRDQAVDTIVRFTGNCIGQAAVQEAQGSSASDLALTPSDPNRSIYKVLPNGEGPIFTVIDADASARAALHAGNDDATVSLISRMTGRCVGQTLFSLALGLPSIVGKLLAL